MAHNMHINYWFSPWNSRK